MHIKIKQFKRINLLLPALFAVLVIFAFLALPGRAEAAPSADCSDKENPAECRQEVADRCQSPSADAQDRCRKNVAREFPDKPPFALGENDGKYQCGNGASVVKTKFNFGCLGKDGPADITPVEDLVYALIRFLSIGIGLIIVGSIILSGIQYSTSEGNPEATQAAKNRIRDAVIGLFIYLLAFALIQYLVPGGAFK